MQAKPLYTILFITTVCVVCSLLVSTSAVLLKPRQEANIELDRRKNVLIAVGKVGNDETVSAEQIDELFSEITPVVIDLKSGEETDVDPAAFDQKRATKDPAVSSVAPENNAGIQRIADQALVYKVMQGDQAEVIFHMFILPIRLPARKGFGRPELPRYRDRPCPPSPKGVRPGGEAASTRRRSASGSNRPGLRPAGTRQSRSF